MTRAVTRTLSPRLGPAAPRRAGPGPGASGPGPFPSHWQPQADGLPVRRVTGTARAPGLRAGSPLTHWQAQARPAGRSRAGQSVQDYTGKFKFRLAASTGAPRLQFLQSSGCLWPNLKQTCVNAGRRRCCSARAAAVPGRRPAARQRPQKRFQAREARPSRRQHF